LTHLLDGSARPYGVGLAVAFAIDDFFRIEQQPDDDADQY